MSLLSNALVRKSFVMVSTGSCIIFVYANLFAPQLTTWYVSVAMPEIHPTVLVIIISKFIMKSLVYPVWLIWTAYIDGLAQDCSNSIVNALELLQCCTEP